MQNLLGTCLAIGVLAGGFMVTGDLQRLAARGMRVIEATDVPDADAPVPVPEPPGSTDAPAPSPAVRRRDEAGLDRVEVTACRPGQRILLWLGTAAEPVAVDVVDPRGAAVILERRTPRRAAIVGGVLERHRTLEVVPVGLAHGAAPIAERLGTVTGLALEP